MNDLLEALPGIVVLMCARQTTKPDLSCLNSARPSDRMRCGDRSSGTKRLILLQLEGTDSLETSTGQCPVQVVGGGSSLGGSIAGRNPFGPEHSRRLGRQPRDIWTIVGIGGSHIALFCSLWKGIRDRCSDSIIAHEMGNAAKKCSYCAFRSDTSAGLTCNANR